MLQRQNELLRSSEAAYQREAQLVSVGPTTPKCCHDLVLRKQTT